MRHPHKQLSKLALAAIVLGIPIAFGGSFILLEKTDYRQQPEYINFMVDCLEKGGRERDCHSLHYYRNKQ